MIPALEQIAQVIVGMIPNRNWMQSHLLAKTRQKCELVHIPSVKSDLA
jgi:hypothetical protein